MQSLNVVTGDTHTKVNFQNPIFLVTIVLDIKTYLWCPNMSQYQMTIR